MPLLKQKQFLKRMGLSSDRMPIHCRPSATILFTVNGRDAGFQDIREISLLEFLRRDLGLHGSKYGCGVGVCGACTVLINNSPMRSCVVNPRHLEGMNVITIEGVERSGKGSEAIQRVQRTFSELGVFQCGYCAPGFVLSAGCLLRDNPDPTEKEIRRGLHGNLCRCTGYQKIIESVRAAADPQFKRRLLKQPSYSFAGVSQASEKKVTGALLYTRDLHMPDQLWAQVVWSRFPRARIRAIDKTPAEKVTGVSRVITHGDLPRGKTFGVIFSDQPVLVKTEVRSVADAVALVLAETPEAAEEGANRLNVEYEPLSGVFDPMISLAPDAPRLTAKGNMAHHLTCRKGDIEKGREMAEVVIKGRYRTPMVDPAFMEPEACLTYLDPDKTLVVVTASQAPISYRNQIAAICDLKRDRVRLRTFPAGGAFGGRGDLTIQHLCALGTRLTGRPVRLGLTREESMRVHSHRHPFVLDYETGADGTGRLTHCVVRGTADAGAYHSATLAVVENAVVFATGPYEVNHVDTKVTAAYTNNPTSGAMRGFGVPQVCLAMECQMDRLARRLGLDPMAMRMKNTLEAGKVSQWGQVMGPDVGIKACLESLLPVIKAMRTNVPVSSGEKLGVGLSAGYKNSSTPTMIPEGSTDVTLRLSDDGMIEVVTGGCELGQGLEDALSRITAQALDFPQALDLLVPRIQIIPGSTDHTTSRMLTSASQQVFLTGGAILRAAVKFKKQLFQSAARVLQKPLGALELKPDGVGENNGVFISLENLAQKCVRSGQLPTVHEIYTPPVKNMFPPEIVTKVGPDQRMVPSLGYVAAAVAVAVNEKTGRVRVLKVALAQDVGRAINPSGIVGQVQGGVAMGLGWCFKERINLAEGVIQNDNFDRYHMPRTTDTPPIETIIVEVPDPLGPMGAKGIGELPVVPIAPAVLNAIRDAVGVDLEEIPVRPEDIRKMLP
ncbi:MAG: molybdopterin-dependent oxidoreductase [Deltaproteobacteria bacterium]|nr:molybdopterin-dependent oxidoreductase [Deltaproteobacteria bacterium]